MVLRTCVLASAGSREARHAPARPALLFRHRPPPAARGRLVAEVAGVGGQGHSYGAIPAELSAVRERSRPEPAALVLRPAQERSHHPEKVGDGECRFDQTPDDAHTPRSISSHRPMSVLLTHFCLAGRGPTRQRVRRSVPRGNRRSSRGNRPPSPVRRPVPA